MVEQMYGGWFSIPGTSTMESRFFEMSLLPPEIINEVNNLVNGRYLFEGFSLLGKKMPDNKDRFHTILHIRWHIILVGIMSIGTCL